jgi:hypothetical protein
MIQPLKRKHLSDLFCMCKKDSWATTTPHCRTGWMEDIQSYDQSPERFLLWGWFLLTPSRRNFNTLRFDAGFALRKLISLAIRKIWYEAWWLSLVRIRYLSWDRVWAQPRSETSTARMRRIGIDMIEKSLTSVEDICGVYRSLYKIQEHPAS